MTSSNGRRVESDRLLGKSCSTFEVSTPREHDPTTGSDQRDGFPVIFAHEVFGSLHRRNASSLRPRSMSTCARDAAVVQL